MTAVRSQRALRDELEVAWRRRAWEASMAPKADALLSRTYDALAVVLNEEKRRGLENLTLVLGHALRNGQEIDEALEREVEEMLARALATVGQ